MRVQLILKVLYDNADVFSLLSNQMLIVYKNNYIVEENINVCTTNTHLKLNPAAMVLLETLMSRRVKSYFGWQLE